MIYLIPINISDPNLPVPVKTLSETDGSRRARVTHGQTKNPDMYSHKVDFAQSIC